MNSTDNNRDKDPEWAYETIRPRFYHEYKLLEKVEFLTYFFVGPNKRKHKDLVEFIPRKTILNDITPKIRIGIVGDIMKMKNRELILGNSLRNYFSDIDYFVGNFEGIITNRKHEVVSEQIHDENMLEILKTLHPPEKTILTYSNNHCNDFGWNEYKKSYQKVKDHGFIVIGRRDEPSVMLEDSINLAAATAWSDHPCEFVSGFKQVKELYNPEAKFNIFYPHWGYELQLYPHPCQVEYSKMMLKKWDMIVGHHTHNPQPVTELSTKKGKKLVAYSLGNFSYGVLWKIYHHSGIVLKFDIGPNKDGKWQVGNVNWEFVLLYFNKNRKVLLDLNKNCRWFNGI
ncbi:MAG TPA: CapA family protein [Candidatus Bathyarchaeia archaeon]|nr:CapA family protein [Candidatus Bathyarchaeia archaeon]